MPAVAGLDRPSANSGLKKTQPWRTAVGALHIVLHRHTMPPISMNISNYEPIRYFGYCGRELILPGIGRRGGLFSC